MNDIELPWSPRSRQKEGDQTEKRIAKQKGARVHPRSGAGSIKWDASTEDELIEVKDSKKSHTLNGALLNKLLIDATRQGKEAVYIVKFRTFNLVAEIRLRRDGT